jgi:hypothetical protein
LIYLLLGVATAACGVIYFGLVTVHCGITILIHVCARLVCAFTTSFRFQLGAWNLVLPTNAIFWRRAAGVMTLLGWASVPIGVYLRHFYY